VEQRTARPRVRRWRARGGGAKLVLWTSRPPAVPRDTPGQAVRDGKVGGKP